MALPSKADISKLEFARFGVPFVRVEAKTLSTNTLNLAQNGAPFYAATAAAASTPLPLTGSIREVLRGNSSTATAATAAKGGAVKTVPRTTDATLTGSVALTGTDRSLPRTTDATLTGSVALTGTQRLIETVAGSTLGMRILLALTGYAKNPHRISGIAATIATPIGGKTRSVARATGATAANATAVKATKVVDTSSLHSVTITARTAISGKIAQTERLNSATATTITGMTGSVLETVKLSKGVSNSLHSLFAPTENPTNNVGVTDTGAITVGTRFTTDLNGNVTGVRVYRELSGDALTALLYNQTGSLLASVNFTSVAGWQTVLFPSPIAITSGVAYTAAYFMAAGRYSYTSHRFDTQLDNVPLHGPATTNSVYAYAGSATYPTNAFNATWYGVDVVFDSLDGASGTVLTFVTEMSGRVREAIRSVSAQATQATVLKGGAVRESAVTQSSIPNTLFALFGRIAQITRSGSASQTSSVRLSASRVTEPTRLSGATAASATTLVGKVREQLRVKGHRFTTASDFFGAIFALGLAKSATITVKTAVGGKIKDAVAVRSSGMIAAFYQSFTVIINTLSAFSVGIKTDNQDTAALSEDLITACTITQSEADQVIISENQSDQVSILQISQTDMEILK